MIADETNATTADQNSPETQQMSPGSQQQDDDPFRWTRPAVLLLLDLYSSRKSAFKNPNRKKKTLWEEIVLEMKQKGYEVTWVVVEKKMRNLRQTHKSIRDNNSKTGRGRKTWEYFEKMEEIFGEDATVSITNITESAAAEDEVGEANKSQESDEAPSAVENLPARCKKRKRDCGNQGNKFERLVVAVDSARKVEEKKVKVMQDLCESMKTATAERTKATHELNETLKELVKKL